MRPIYCAIGWQILECPQDPAEAWELAEARDGNRHQTLRGEGLTMIRALLAALAVTVCCLGNPAALPPDSPNNPAIQ